MLNQNWYPVTMHGGEFQRINTTKIPHPSEHPQANGVIERLHEELGKLCRIFNEFPDAAYRRLNTANSKLIFHTHLKNIYHDCFNSLWTYETTASPLINFLAIDALNLDILEGKPINIKFFIIPDWPCAEWYKPLHEQILAEAVKLPDDEDLFILQDNVAINWENFHRITGYLS